MINEENEAHGAAGLERFALAQICSFRRGEGGFVGMHSREYEVFYLASFSPGVTQNEILSCRVSVPRPPGADIIRTAPSPTTLEYIDPCTT